MKYISTRGKGGILGFPEVVLAGLAKDGGLYVPDHFPRVTKDEIDQFCKYEYHQVAFAIMKKFAPDMNASKLWTAVRNSYKPEIFGNVNNGDNAFEIVPIHKLDNNLFLARLSNGPTLAFKDLGLQPLGHLFETVLSGKNLNVLGATSGDTGSAAIRAMLGRKGISVFMLSPREGMSAFQSAQMWGVNDEAIHNIAIRGSFDDCQNIVKLINADAEFKQKYSLGAVNSINWARIAAQVPYYFRAYSRACGEAGGQVDFAIPTGNFGNIYAAYVAKMMGLPIRNLILATNENDVLHEFFVTGIYQPRSKTITTSSPSMDITSASNFERYIYHLLGGDAVRVAGLWRELKDTGRFDLSHLLNEINATGITSHSISEADSYAVIRETYNQYDVIIDPHTAIAMSAGRRMINDGVPMIVMETAQPCKFDETISKVLGTTAQVPSGMKGVINAEQFFTVLDPDAEQVMDFIRQRA